VTNLTTENIEKIKLKFKFKAEIPVIKSSNRASNIKKNLSEILLRINSQKNEYQ